MTPNAVPSPGAAGTDAGDAPGSAVTRSRRPEVPRAAGTAVGDAAVHRTVMPVMKFEYARFGSPPSSGRVVSHTRSP